MLGSKSSYARVTENKLIRALSSNPPQKFGLAGSPKTLSQFGGVHGGTQPGANKMWRNTPLFRRDNGDKIFKTGTDATQLLINEAIRKDAGSLEFLQSWENVVNSLAVVIDRTPKYAWILKQLLEPDRTITFRVSRIDDLGISRVNRGFRIQYSSALGPYEGGLCFAS